MRTDPRDIWVNLKIIAPNIAFGMSREEDPDFVWDGDGPDPREEGATAYDVYIRAEAVVDGEHIEGHASLGGHLLMPGESDDDISGYLPQMLEEAAEELETQATGAVKKQAKAAREYLKKVLRARYKEQRA